MRNARPRAAADQYRVNEERLRDELRAAENEWATLAAEVKALSALADGADLTASSPVTDVLDVQAGYEKALGVALGDDLSASMDAKDPMFWAELPPQNGAMGLPKGAEPLTRYVKGPAALNRRLAQVGVVKGAAEAAKLQGDLGQGQRLVSRKGGLWRWDGFVIQEGAPTSAATRLEQKNRLMDLRGQLAESEAALETRKAGSQAELEALKAEMEARQEEIRLQAEAEVEEARQAFDVAGEAEACSWRAPARGPGPAAGKLRQG